MPCDTSPFKEDATQTQTHPIASLHVGQDGPGTSTASTQLFLDSGDHIGVYLNIYVFYKVSCV